MPHQLRSVPARHRIEPLRAIRQVPAQNCQGSLFVLDRDAVLDVTLIQQRDQQASVIGTDIDMSC